MDSSVNITSETINFKKYLLENKDTLDLILKNLEKLSAKSKSFLKDSLTKDGRLDNYKIDQKQDNFEFGMSDAKFVKFLSERTQKDLTKIKEVQEQDEKPATGLMSRPTEEEDE